MKLRNILFQIAIPTIPTIPIIALTSCSVVSEDAPVKLESSVFEANNKSSFDNIFNLLSVQESEKNSFILKNTEQINEAVQKIIDKDKGIQEKLRLYFFKSIYDSLYKVDVLIDGKLDYIEAQGERLTAVDNIKSFISKSSEADDNFKSIEEELLKIINMKLVLSLKVENEIQSGWVWEMQFNLDSGSELAKFIQGEDNTNKRGVFYKRVNISDEEKSAAKALAYKQFPEYDPIKNPLPEWKYIYDAEILQAQYQSSKWYWDNETRMVKSIKLGSNVNPYSTDGTIGGFSSDDSKRTLFGIDFEQLSNNITLYKPVLLFKSNNVIKSYINSDWEKFLEYKKYIDKDSTESGKANKEKVKDIKIDLICSPVKYDKKI